MENEEINKFTADLLKKSLLATPSRDFSDRVMQKITSTASLSVKINGYLKRAWLFFILVVLFMPMAYVFSTEIFRTYFTVIHETVRQSFVFVKYIAFAAFLVLVLVQLDMLVKHYFSRSKANVMAGS